MQKTIKQPATERKERLPQLEPPMIIPDKLDYVKKKLGFEPDKWQMRVLEASKNVVIRSGRQVGKSTIVALKAFFFAVENPKKTVLVVAASQRQSGLLFEKMKSFVIETMPDYIEGEPTQTRLELKNGTRIYALPAGRTGYAIRGYSIDLLIADEAAFISEAVWVAIIPMLAVTKGTLILLSTPFGKGGYFYNCFGDPDYLQFHISSENCPRIPKQFLQKEKSRMTKLEYAQEYLGEFIEEFTQFFPTELIKSCCTFLEWSYKKDYKDNLRYYLGVDVARYGGDENAFSICEMQNDGRLRLVKALTTKNIALTDTIGRIQDLNRLFNFRKIFIDDAGVGAGVLDVLLEKLGSRVVGINNSTKSIDREKKRKLKILKEDLYSNLRVLMEQKKIEMIDSPDLKHSLASMRFEYTSERNLRIYGSYSHIAESIVRAAWCIKAKGLKLFVA